MEVQLSDLAAGGVCAWRLSGDETAPATARSLLSQVMDGLGLDQELIGDGRLAVSETATNAIRHGGSAPSEQIELWIWARTHPVPQLVVSVFDGERATLPCSSSGDVLDEHGKGLMLLGEFATEWGSAPTRSRLCSQAVLGKAVWFALPLPSGWPGLRFRIHPATAAQCLLLNLVRRGFSGSHTTGPHGVSVVELPGLNVWVHDCFSWRDGDGRCVRRPLVDLQETTEHIVHHLDGR